MAILTLYGSSVADTTLTTACKMAAASGGVETSKLTTFSALNNYGELYSQGGTSATVVAIPASASGHGWVYSTGAGAFAAGNWSALVTLSLPSADSTGSRTIRFFKYSGGSYTSIGTITDATGNIAVKTTYTLASTAMGAMVFASGDLLYVDLWFQDSTGAFGDNPTVYEATSSTSGVANDMQVTTSTFTAGGVTHLRISDGYGGVFS